MVLKTITAASCHHQPFGDDALLITTAALFMKRRWRHFSLLVCCMTRRCNHICCTIIKLRTFRIKMDENILYIKIVDLEEIDNFVFDDFFIWNHLWSQNFVWSCRQHFKILKNQNFQTNSNEKSTKTRVIDFNENNSFVVDNFINKNHLLSQFCIWSLKFEEHTLIATRNRRMQCISAVWTRVGQLPFTFAI